MFLQDAIEVRITLSELVVCMHTVVSLSEYASQLDNIEVSVFFSLPLLSV
jgi:hypothetical protein